MFFYISLFADGEKVDSAHVHHIRNVIVSALQIHKDIIPVQVLQGEELNKLNAHSVADAIRYFSGLQIKDYGGIGGLKTVNIRGMGTEHVGVFYDGIELGNAQNGTIDLGRFSLDNMESVMVCNGQKGAIFQSAKDFGSAGTVYLQTRIPVFTPYKSNNVKATFKTGSFGLTNPSILWEHLITKKISGSFNAEYMYTTGRYKFSYAKQNGYDTTEVRHNGDVEVMRAEYGLYGKLNNGEWRIKNYFYNSKRGFPGAVVREEPGKFTHADRQWDTDYFVQASLKKEINGWYGLQLNGKYAYDYLHYLSDPRLDVTVTTYTNNHYHQKEFYLSSANRFVLSPIFSGDVSVDVQRNTLTADLSQFVNPRRFTLLTATAAAINLSHWQIQGSMLFTYAHEKVNEFGSPSPDKKKFTPTVIFSWQPDEKKELNIRAFYKRVFRMPTLNDLYYTFIGNKDLKPEETTQYDAGITYNHYFDGLLLSSVRLQADGYYNKVKNKIVAMPTSNQFRWTMMNFGLVEIKGIDFSMGADWRFGNKLTMNTHLSYTYQKAQDFSRSKDDEYYGGQIPYIPWHSGSFIMNGSYCLWDWSYSFIYTGKRYTSSANIPANKERPWYTSDCSLAHRFLWKKKEIKLTAEVNNLLNQQYEVVQCYPMPGINMKIILSISL